MILGQILGWGMRTRFGERALIGSGPGILARIPSELCEAPTSGCSVGRLHVYSWPCEVTVPVIIPISRVITQEGGEPEAVVQLAECLPSIGPWVTPPALHKPSMVVCVIPARRRWRQDEKCRVILSFIGTSSLPPTTPSIISR